jgi:hypothetical protein
MVVLYEHLAGLDRLHFCSRQMFGDDPGATA